MDIEHDFSDEQQCMLHVDNIFQVLSKSLPSDQIQPFLEQLYEGLQDPQDNSSSGACVVLNSVVKARGGELTPEVSTDRAW